ncbi:MAG: FadR family transcriptional regulator [Chloroflexi bacterium]|nr:FadR family transcriptional regulator [Chloroflexota bacterium]
MNSRALDGGITTRPGRPARRERSPSKNGARLSEMAQQAIKRYILDRRLEGGDLLPTEGQLVQELGMSRTAVREAVKALEALGMLEARPGIGLIVRPFSFDPILDNLAYSLLVDRTSVLDLLFVRKQLEAGAIEVAAATMSPAQLRVLRSLVDCMGERAAHGEAFTEEDRFFHRALYTGLENPLLLKLLDVFWQVYRRLRDQAPRIEDVDLVRSWEDHRMIVEALERGDAAAARAAVATHFTVLEQRIGRGPLGSMGASPVPPAEQLRPLGMEQQAIEQ